MQRSNDQHHSLTRNTAYYNNLGESKLPRSKASSKMYCRSASCNRSSLNLQRALG